MLTLAVGDLVRRIHDRVPAALADEPDAVHRLRTSVRRLRNVLAAFRRYLDKDATAELRSLLKEWGDVLGRARDLEVRTLDAGATADTAGLGAADRSALLDPLEAAHEQAHAEVVRWTRSKRGQDLARLLDDWAAAPRLDERASRSAKKAARRAVRRQAERTLRSATELTELEKAHELRKAARRLRHTCDAIMRKPVGLLGRRTKDVGATAHQIQSLLGEHRDALLLAAHVRDRANGSAAYDAVVDLCQERALTALADLPAALGELGAPKER
ncbi:CHAD domain-containing protein [Promicromonospora iranensis]|uniref:CHAD domain-containing protein n=1 Tax=Promicromonospora iranensis TaxID=1105144 RepID=A0ABU2CI50_9MICO|nr:CHAD domain-containing protein [Promicromonospora iranensis]MDR7381004.1 CHAD domain-containing protein [Promicromonospora iranensis]